MPRDEDEAALEKMLEDENEEDMSDSGEDNEGTKFSFSFLELIEK